MEEKILTVLVEGDAPRIRDAELGVADEFFALWGVAVKSSVGASDWAVGGFHVGVEEDAFAHHDGT